MTDANVVRERSAARALNQRHSVSAHVWGFQAQQELWDELEREPDFFRHLRFAPDGGFSEVGLLFGGGRWFWAFVSIAFLFMNVQTVLVTNIRVLLNVQDISEFLNAPHDVSAWMMKPSEKKNFLLINGVLRHFHVTVEGTQVEFRGEKLVALLELLLVAIAVLKILKRLIRSRCTRSEFVKWYEISKIFWEGVPELAVVSALVMLNFVTPQVLVPELVLQFNQMVDRRCSACGRYLIAFLVTRVACGIIGFDAFLTKLRIVAGIVNDDDENDYIVVCTALSFMNQMLGVVKVSWFVRRRLFVFIFAGEDGFLSDREDAVRQVWEAMLAQRIFQEYSLSKAIALCLSYGDGDFQRLALNESSSRAALSQPRSFAAAGRGVDVEMKQSV